MVERRAIPAMIRRTSRTPILEPALLVNVGALRLPFAAKAASSFSFVAADRDRTFGEDMFECRWWMASPLLCYGKGMLPTDIHFLYLGTSSCL